MPPTSTPSNRIGNPPGNPVMVPSVATAIVTRTASGRAPLGLPVEAAVCALAVADFIDRTRLPAIRTELKESVAPCLINPT